MASKKEWDSIQKDDVLKALKRFREEHPRCPAARNTFLVFEGEKYPAKHIRGMAYYEVFHREVSKEEYTGGKETADFFLRLGFEVQYKGDILKETPGGADAAAVLDPTEGKAGIDGKNITEKKPLNIGLYLQTDNVRKCFSFRSFHLFRPFEHDMDIAENSDIDILVFPETCYTRFSGFVHSKGIFEGDHLEKIKEKCRELSKKIHKAIVFSGEDHDGTLFSLFYNAESQPGETESHLYIKHTATAHSAFDFPDYRTGLMKQLFQPILFKGYKIGLTICYDCNHSLFSRMYGAQGIDIILNSTGGNVVHHKWNRYNKARAIENHCCNFVTMGGDGRDNSYVFGFNRKGGELPFSNLMRDTQEQNEVGTIYEYCLPAEEEEPSSDQQTLSVSKNQDLQIPVGHVDHILGHADLLAESIYRLPVEKMNVIFCLLKENDILKPEKVLPLLYHPVLKSIPRKKYILVSRYKHLDNSFYNNQLSTILKVRAMENYCAVLLESDLVNQCYQTSDNRNAQVVKPVSGSWGIDLRQAGGPEVIWRNKADMKAAWRENFEWLIQQLCQGTFSDSKYSG